MNANIIKWILYPSIQSQEEDNLHSFLNQRGVDR